MSKASPSRTRTAHLKSFARTGPESVTYDLSGAPRSVRLTIPPRSRWRSGLHWHETHTETLTVERGAARVTRGAERVVVRAGAGSGGVVVIEPFVVHEWHRADVDVGGGGEGDGDGEDLVVTTKFAPVDESKEAFFRMINSFLLEEDPGRLYDLPRSLEGARAWAEKLTVLVQLGVIFREFDNWPVLLGLGEGGGRVGWMGWGVSHLACALAVVLGWVLGIRGMYGEYVAGTGLGEGKKMR